jgi:MFS family permease
MILGIAALGWLFDTMDGQIFLASRSITMRDLLPGVDESVRRQYGSLCTSLFILGWAAGGLIFGVVGDRWGRVKTMALTILLYAGFTGLSALARTWQEFGAIRFLTGLGVGGEFAAGAALVAESMPEAARARALGLLQSLSAVGNVAGAALLGVIVPAWGWRGLYLVGAFPALLAVVVQASFPEPKKWIAARAAAHGRPLGGLRDLFADPRWRTRALVGVSLAIAGVVGLWGIGFYSPELIDEVLGGLPAAELTAIKSRALMLQQVGAFAGMWTFAVIAERRGRIPAFRIAFGAAWASLLLVFLGFRSPSQVYWMWPVLGFGTLMPFGGYALYFPELFPTRLRTTGTGFCYNTGRVVAALGPPLLAWLAIGFNGRTAVSGFRLAAAAVSTCYLIGFAALHWAPETRGLALPED